MSQTNNQSDDFDKLLDKFTESKKDGKLLYDEKGNEVVGVYKVVAKPVSRF